MIGQSVSHYRILEKLGEGGMGVVYKAQDTNLDRLVALKFLPPHFAGEEERQRFVHEAKAASSLDHPNICTFYEIGEAESGHIFIAMAYYEGQTLKEKIGDRPLPFEEAVEIVISVAHGLAHAHEKGVTHRDIKPDNLMLTAKGIPKIMDFGLARVGGLSTITKTGATIGTVPYMSPEQARGEKVDHRSDIWSLGVVLYEMIAGRLPFRSTYQEAVVYSIMNEEPPPLTSLRSDVPMELERIVKKATRKSVADRYQHVEEMVSDLRILKKELESGVSRDRPDEAAPRRKHVALYVGLAALALILVVGGLLLFRGGTTPTEFANLTTETHENKSIAVLPFVNMSADKEDEYFSDGITEELINALSRLGELHVAARTSSFAFKGKTEDVGKIGHALRVGTVLEGSVRKAGNRLRITAQLINVSNGYHIWSNTYERELKDVFAVQDDITKNIVSELKVKFRGDEGTVSSSRTTNPDAHDLYLKGRFFMNSSGEHGLRNALQYFRQALDKDPGYAAPYAGIGFTYLWLADAYLPPKEAYPRAKVAAQKALELDSTNVEAHAALGSVLFLYDWDFPFAEREGRRALQLSPNSFEANFWYAQFLLVTGRLEEALARNDIVMKLDPLSALASFQRVWCLYAARRFDQTLQEHKRMLDLDPNFFYLDVNSAAAYREKKMYKESLEEYGRARQVTGEAPLFGLAITYARMGQTEEAKKILAELKTLREKQYVPADEIAMIYSNLGDKNSAFDWLNRSYEERSALLLFLKSWPEYDPIRSDPRFTELTKKVFGEN